MFQKIEYYPKVLKQLKNLPKVERKKIIRKLELLADSPYSGKMLEGKFDGLFSLKAWPYRIIYQIKKDYIFVYSIKHRQSAYK